MKNFNSYRVFNRNAKPVNENGDYVLYWMSINRRLNYNFALEYAVAWANKLKKPLLIYEGLSCDIPWASDRFHKFLIEGMHENATECDRLGISCYTYVEFNPGEGEGLVENLIQNSCLTIADEFPVYIIRPYNRLMSSKANVPYITVDSNGLIPLGLTEKEPYSAFFFRMTMQKYFKEAFLNPPKENPLDDVIIKNQVQLSDHFLNKYPDARPLFDNIADTVSKLKIDHSVKALTVKGTRSFALDKMKTFLDIKLSDYADKRNDPDADMSSGLSGWLHYGKISEYEIVKASLQKQPESWNIDQIKYNKGQRYGFFGGHTYIESFLDELITWREVGFHFCHHVKNYDKFNSLPDWAIESLESHSSDKREYIYTLDQFEKAQTHDPIWNAAQRQLVREGYIHNYLRMLWGKKVLEWTNHPQTALEYLIHLNNKYAIDGRDPNSYSGIFWIFGRFDRPWGPERPIYGKVRYMTSDNTAKKVKLKSYLEKFTNF